MIAQWERFNPIERYGVLLESWFLRGSPEIIREPGRAFELFHNFDDVSELASRLISKLYPERLLPDLPYFPGYYNLALMEMFGWVEIQGRESRKASGWQLITS